MDKAKEFKKIMTNSNTNKVMLFTSHYKITGDVYECDECNREHFINLVNASICFVGENIHSEDCDLYSVQKYDWLHINLCQIQAFSFLNQSN